MIEVRQTKIFKDWLSKLADRRAVVRITQRLARIEVGLFGDTKSIGGKVSELRIDYGPGYRLYFTQHGTTVIVLLCGGDKGSQTKDTKTAKAMVQELEE